MSERDPLLSSGNEGSRSEKTKHTALDLPSSQVKYYFNENVGWMERRRRRKYLQAYNARLSELRTLYVEDEETLRGEAKPKEDERAPDRLLARTVFLLNVCLLFANLAASILSTSLAVISTFVDSFMDITSSVILGVCLWLINNTNMFHYPRGRDRLELIGVVLCSVIMGIANMVMIMQSITAILTDKESPDVDLITFSILASGSLIKLVFCIICFKRGTSSSKVLAMDMRNDMATSMVALVSAMIGDRYWKYADPIGAIAVCGLIALSWFHHALEHIPILVGIRAEGEQLSRILRIATNHDDRIKCIDHVMVYRTGASAIVELHIVMDEDLPLKVTHDISHPLEKKLLLLDFVERAFVHCDYDCDGD